MTFPAGGIAARLGAPTTFHRDKQTLLRLLPVLEADFGALGDSFGGMALHELR